MQRVVARSASLSRQSFERASFERATQDDIFRPFRPTQEHGKLSRESPKLSLESRTQLALPKPPDLVQLQKAFVFPRTVPGPGFFLF